MTDSRSSFDSNQSTRNLHVDRIVPSDVITRRDTLTPQPIEVASFRHEASATSDDDLRIVCEGDLSREDLTGYILGQYALGRKIGQGGMGAVFVARHLMLDKQFAIKFISTDISRSSEAAARFDQEVVALGQLRHPNIVNAIDAGSLNGVKYLVTEFAEGQDFEALTEKYGSLPVTEACGLIRQAALGLAYAHRAGFVHRDIKPSNLILDRSNVVKILDFGLVRNASVRGRLTEDGRIFGSLDFIAPEQAHDASCVDARGDIYGLGCTLLFLLSGQPPFSDAHYSSMAAKLKGHLFDRPAWFNHVPPGVPQELVNLLERMTAKSPTLRVQTAQEVADRLAAFTSNVDLPGPRTQIVPSVCTVPEAPASHSPGNQQKRWRRPWLKTAMGSVACFIGYMCFDSGPADPIRIESVKAPVPELPQIVSIRDGAGAMPRKKLQPPASIRVETW